MPKYRHLELLNGGPVSKVRLLNHRPYDYGGDAVAELAGEWNSVADGADCRSLVVDCSNVCHLSSEMLSKLILLQRRLKRKEGKLILCGISPDAREVFRWTKLDRIFEIEENEQQEAAAFV